MKFISRSTRLTLVLMLGLGAATKVFAADWPQFLGPTRNGVSPEVLSDNWPAGGPTVVWNRDVGQGFAGPVVSGGKLLLFHRVDDKERIECMSARDGTPIWVADYATAYVDDFGFDEGPRGMPAVFDGKIYTFGAEGALHCWALADGKPLWSVDTREKLKTDKAFFGVACSPLVEGNAVILNVGGKGAGVVAFDRNDGHVLWRATDDAAGYASPTAATIGDRRVIFAFTRAGLAALDPANGNPFFHFPWRSRMDASVNAATPIVVGNEVFLSASYGTGCALLSLDPKNLSKEPRPLWSGDHILSSHYATSVYRDGFLYGFDGRQEQGPSLRCVEWKTGKARWTAEGFGAGTVTLAGDDLLILTEKGQLVLAPATPTEFKPIAKAQVLGFEVRAYPALADGLMYARDKNKLVCLDLRKR